MVNEEIIRAKVLIAPGAICHQLDAIRWLAGSKQVTVTPSYHPVGFVTGSNIPRSNTVPQFSIPSLYLM